MNWFSRGIRSAFRNATRTFALVIILGLSISLALSMLIAHQAVTQKINNVKSSVDNTISIFPAGLRGFTGGGNPLTSAQLLEVSKTTDVSSVAETLSDRMTSSETNIQSPISAGVLGRRFARKVGGLGGVFGNYGGQSFTLPVIVNGTNDPTNLSAFSHTGGGGTFTLQSGTVFNSNSNANVALLGSSIASKNNLKVGSTFTAYSTTITVAGIFSTGNRFGDSQVIMPLQTVQRLTGQTNQITSAVAYVNSVSNVASVTAAIKKELGSAADVTNSIAQAQSIVSALQNIQTISLYSLIGAVIVGAIIILMTMIMIVRERRREIGVIKAIGSSNIRIVGQFMAEAVTLTLVGAIIGITFGVIASKPITQMLVSSSNSSSSSSSRSSLAGSGSGGNFAAHHSSGGHGISTRVKHDISSVHAVVNFSIVVDGLVAAIFIALIGSAVAAYFIAKIRPAEVMRVE